MTEDEAVAALDAIDTTRGPSGFQDAATHHADADAILLDFLKANHPAVQEAYDRLEGRCDWWAFA